MKYTELLNHPLLSRAEERQLIRETQTGNEHSRERLILANLRLVNQIALGYARPDKGVSAEDLIADGIQGLMHVIEIFDVDRGYSLSTHAYLPILQALICSLLLEEIIRIPVHVREKHAQIQNAKTVLLASGDPAPTFQEIAEVSGGSVADVQQHARLDQTVIGVASLDEPISEDGDTRLAEILTTSETNIDDAEIQMDLDRFLSILPETERFILTRSYGIPVKVPTDEIARLFGRSKQWVYDTLEKTLSALQRLDRALKNRRTEDAEALGVDAPHRMMKLRPVGVPKGISFLNGEVVKEKETAH